MWTSARRATQSNAAVGEVRMSATSLSAMGMPMALRLVAVHTPADGRSRARIARLPAEPGLPPVDHSHR
ncbi:hypothetical protein ACIOEW_30320 [Streptomyces sp. NPDC087901]|uniref:hypothetical protein n=1 Tax=Streptomyces sp. NPDC087901 TaxID=3365818 RepID=UPI00380AAC42